MIEIGGIAITSAFFAGLIMFLAPCTFPLVPGYLGFISGVSTKDLEDPMRRDAARKKIFVNGVLFVLGFSVVFVLFGTFAGFLGAQFGLFQDIMRRVGGVLVILFGLFMLGVFRIPFLQQERRLKFPTFLKVGTGPSSFIIGSAFAIGWTPCVGPILGGILALATQSSTALQGAILLGIFSLGLAVPFLVIAATFSRATKYVNTISHYLHYVEKIGGIFLIFLGILLFTNNFGLLIELGFEYFDFFDEVLLDYL